MTDDEYADWVYEQVDRMAASLKGIRLDLIAMEEQCS